jgi:hypothetical protein
MTMAAIHLVTGPMHRPSTTHPNTLALGSGSALRLSDWGRSPRLNPRGLTSNRHAGRPDRWSIRAFAYAPTPRRRPKAFNIGLLRNGFSLLEAATEIGSLSKGKWGDGQECRT